jgi:hypothetical protein
MVGFYVSIAGQSLVGRRFDLNEAPGARPLNRF